MSALGVATKARILDAAEELFGERGFAGTSLRAVTAAATANVAAVRYHFGGKEGLLRAVADRAMAPVNEERLKALRDMQATGSDADVASLVRAFVVPSAELVHRHGERGLHVARFIGRVMFEPEGEVRRMFAEQVDPVEGLYLAALTKALPDLVEEEVVFRYRAMVGLLALHQTGALADLATRSAAPADRAQVTEWLVTMITSSFLAPSTVTC
ncbi:TetR/AcrR family transcriptional regulator [Actinomadura geliboluensis]|uniref:TetR/AcrR family transcriptional regulator n=1 Tax=Actinomadura geliboluensis TaxID=882440 RepID=UPI0014870484|nr:TetR family transcriptional regulator [Actinomadura geliboluensis]